MSRACSSRRRVAPVDTRVCSRVPAVRVRLVECVTRNASDSATRHPSPNHVSRRHDDLAEGAVTCSRNAAGADGWGLRCDLSDPLQIGCMPVGEPRGRPQSQPTPRKHPLIPPMPLPWPRVCDGRCQKEATRACGTEQTPRLTGAQRLAPVRRPGLATGASRWPARDRRDRGIAGVGMNHKGLDHGHHTRPESTQPRPR